MMKSIENYAEDEERVNKEESTDNVENRDDKKKLQTNRVEKPVIARKENKQEQKKEKPTVRKKI